MTAGYQAMHEGAAFADVSSRGRLRMTGEDRLRLLHALATNALEGLAPGQGAETFFLSAQGRIQAHARVYVCADHVLLDTDAGRRDRLREYLESFIVMDDAAVEDVTDSTAAFALQGPAAGAVARAAFGSIPPPAAHAHAGAGDAVVFRSALAGGAGLWLCGPAAEREVVRERLMAAGAVEVSAEDFDLARVENRVPLLDRDYTDANIPHETGQLQIVSATKGCYVGQEIVERVRTQGRVNRLLVPVQLEAAAPPPGDSVTLDGKPAGRLTSARYSPRAGRVVGFALLRREALEAGAKPRAGELPLRIADWPSALRESTNSGPSAPGAAMAH